jgi:cob(I)alamin adenosyltransferase
LRIYTRSGDKGETSLFGGKRVPKDDKRVEAYGAVDELNSELGHCQLVLNFKRGSEVIFQVQRELFALGAMLATENVSKLEEENKLSETSVTNLEKEIDRMEEQLEPLRGFILPSGSESSSRLHVARSVCRRAERRVVSLSKKESIDPIAVKYLNRLSDFLFVLARYENKLAKVPDVFWKQR